LLHIAKRFCSAKSFKNTAWIFFFIVDEHSRPVKYTNITPNSTAEYNLILKGTCGESYTKRIFIILVVCPYCKGYLNQERSAGKTCNMHG
jgi:uncharacterized CHY-type Zn-finger protein